MLHRWSVWMDKKFQTTLNWACDHLSMPGLNLIYVSKRGHWAAFKPCSEVRIKSMMRWYTYGINYIFVQYACHQSKCHACKTSFVANAYLSRALQNDYFTTCTTIKWMTSAASGTLWDLFMIFSLNDLLLHPPNVKGWFMYFMSAETPNR